MQRHTRRWVGNTYYFLNKYDDAVGMVASLHVGVRGSVGRCLLCFRFFVESIICVIICLEVPLWSQSVRPSSRLLLNREIKEERARHIMSVFFTLEYWH